MVPSVLKTGEGLRPCGPARCAVQQVAVPGRSRLRSGEGHLAGCAPFSSGLAPSAQRPPAARAPTPAAQLLLLQRSVSRTD